MSRKTLEMLKKLHFQEVPQKEIARRLGFSEAAVRFHVQKLKGAQNRSGAVEMGVAGVKPEPEYTNSSSGIAVRHSVTLSPDSSPQDYQNELSRSLKVLASQGIAELEPPRNWSEMKILNDMIRKADGLDRSDKGGPVSLLVNVGAGLVRRGASPIVEAETVDSVEDWLV